MAIDAVRTLTDKTILAAQFDDRIAAAPYVEAMFKRVAATGQNNAFGPIFAKHAEPWAYKIRITNVPLIVDRQKFALRVIVKEAFVEASISKTDAEVASLVNALLARGISFDHARTRAWEDLETRRRAGEVFAIELDVTEGKQRMIDAGIPTS